MNVHGLKNSSLLLLSLLIAGCATARVNFRPSSVPEEEGTTFTRITDSSERIYGPQIRITEEGRLLSTSHRWFDVSRDGLRLAYVSQQTYPAVAKVIVKHLEGDNSTCVRSFPGTITDISFLPDCESLAFVIGNGLRWDINLISADSGLAVQRLVPPSGQRLIDDVLQVSDLVFSPQGSWLLYVRHTNRTVDGRTRGAYYVWKYDLRRKTASEVGVGVSASCFPGARFAVIARPDSLTSRGQLWTVDLRTGREHLLASSDVWGFLEPAVSPDGKKIAFVSASGRSNTPVNFDIAVMNSDGSHSRWVTFHPGHDICPRWSPDSKSIYFLSQRGTDKGDWGIWRVDLRR